MAQFFLGVMWSEWLSLWVEFFYKFGVTLNPKGFLAAIPFYFVALCALHSLFARLDDIRRHVPLCFLLGGMMGLTIEWVVVGNSPRGNPHAFQTAQFLFHAVYPVLGYLGAHYPSAGGLKSWLIRYLVLATIVTALGFAFPRSAWRSLWFLFLPIAVYVRLCYFVYRWPIRTEPERVGTYIT